MAVSGNTLLQAALEANWQAGDGRLPCQCGSFKARSHFFKSPFRSKAEEALAQAEQTGMKPSLSKKGSASKANYQRRSWITRPRPGIDRVSSARLISRFIDARPKCIFDNNPAAHPIAIPFDMFQGIGFSHEGDRCTFETLCLAFDISD